MYMYRAYVLSGNLRPQVLWQLRGKLTVIAAAVNVDGVLLLATTMVIPFNFAVVHRLGCYYKIIHIMM